MADSLPCARARLSGPGKHENNLNRFLGKTQDKIFFTATWNMPAERMVEATMGTTRKRRGCLPTSRPSLLNTSLRAESSCAARAVMGRHSREDFHQHSTVPRAGTMSGEAWSRLGPKYPSQNYCDAKEV